MLNAEISVKEDGKVAALRKYLLEDNKPDGDVTEAIARLAVLTEFINSVSDEVFKQSLGVIREFISLNSSSKYEHSLFRSSKFDLTFYPIEREDRALEVMKIILDVVETLSSNRRIIIVKKEFSCYYKDKGYNFPYELQNFQYTNKFKIILDVVETLSSNRRIIIVKKEFSCYYKDKGYNFPYELQNFQYTNKFKFQQMRMFKVLNSKGFVLGKCLDATRHMKIIRSLTKLELTYL